MKRIDNRENNELRDIKIERNYIIHAEGSVLIEFGNTKVICTASVEDKVPPFLKGTGEGWISAEYGMLPRSTGVRKRRESSKGKVEGRTAEVQRLIGRCLRSVVNLKLLGERTIWIDCDVIQADGGTRCAAITGAFVAMVDAINTLDRKERFKKYPIESYVAAVSAGIIENQVFLDLCYEEDANALVDMNFIMTDKDEFIEVQGTGEKRPYTLNELNNMIDICNKSIRELINIQKRVLCEDGKRVGESRVTRMNKVVLASNNNNKLIEIKQILKELNIEVISLKEAGIDIDVVEDGETFSENSYKKASEVKKLTEYAVIADDSGLEVYELDLKPGVYSARFSGEDATDEKNNKKLLEEMKEIKDPKRGARFVTAITLLTPDNVEIKARGEVRGKISEKEIGENGFGYDCLFIPEGLNKTFGEMTMTEKNALSHRNRALQNLKNKLKKL